MYSLLPNCLWALVMAVQLVRTGSRVNIHIRRVDINRFLDVDLFLCLIIALAELFGPYHIGKLVVSIYIILWEIGGKGNWN